MQIPRLLIKLTKTLHKNLSISPIETREIPCTKGFRGVCTSLISPVISPMLQPLSTKAFPAKTLGSEGHFRIH